MSRLRSLIEFVWDFVVGDDWRIALGVVIALGVTALISGTSLAVWWVLPLAVAGLLALSIFSAARKHP